MFAFKEIFNEGSLKSGTFLFVNETFPSYYNNTFTVLKEIVSKTVDRRVHNVFCVTSD